MHDTIIVGAGLSGLTAAAYLCRGGQKPLVLEKSPSCGGLVQSFEREGFTFDTGPRALGNAGILRPMLEDLGIKLPMIDGLVSTGIGDEIVHFDDDQGMEAYLASLRRLFPAAEREIKALGRLIGSSCRMTRVLNRLPNPYFRNPLADPRYLLSSFIPWLPSFLSVALKMGIDRRPIETVLDALSPDPSFKDMVSQHFFKGTPHHFALGYFESFRDYLYPLGGTGSLARALEEAILSGGGRVETGREAAKVIPSARILIDGRGEEYSYGELLWAADLRSLYSRVDTEGIPTRTARGIDREGRSYLDARPGESAFTIFLAVDESPEFFRRISRGHFIYTPLTAGLGTLRTEGLARMKEGFDSLSTEELRAWLRKTCELNSYEISIPVLKDPSLAPEGKTGVVVSILFDGELCALADERGRLDEMKDALSDFMVETLDRSIYPGLRSKLLFSISATPSSLTKRFNTAQGAITGWSLEDKAPVASSLPAIVSAVRTAIPHVWKAGQWSYSPSGVPVAILTGRIAAARMLRRAPVPRKRGS